MRVVLLDVMDALSDIDCSEVLQVLLTPLYFLGGNYRSRSGIQQELGQFRALEPPVICLNGFDHVSWFTCDGNLVGPAPYGFAAGWVCERLAVVIHFDL